MDLMTLIGLIGAIALLVWSILLGAPLKLFYDFPSVVMVCGGSACVTVMSYRPSDLKSLFRVGLRALFFKLPTPQEEIDRIINYANLARKQGLLALEAKLQEVDDKFFAKGIQLVIDGFAADTVRDIMDLEHSFQQQRWPKAPTMIAASFSSIVEKLMSITKNVTSSEIMSLNVTIHSGADCGGSSGTSCLPTASCAPVARRRPARARPAGGSP